MATKHVTLSYDVAHQLDLVKRYEDTAATEHVATSNHDWDLASRLTDLKYTDAALATLADYDWTHDANDRVTQFVSLADGTVDYDYDDRGQLEDADYDAGYGIGDESYTYDENGNRTDHTIGDHNRVAFDGTYNYLYDGEGNRIRRTHQSTDHVTIYDWDHRNRMITVTEYASTTDADAGTNATKRVEQVYDIMDRWIGRFVDSDGDLTGVTQTDDTWFVYDRDQIIYEFEATTGDGDGSAASLKSRFLWGPNRDQFLASEDFSAAATTWTLTDNLGSVRDLVTYDDVANTTTNTGHFTYDAYGKNTVSSDFLFQYTARAFDTTTGLQYNSARWYDPALHFWISVDPGGFAMGDANLYRYVENGPTYATDPTGYDELNVNEWGDYIEELEQDAKKKDVPTSIDQVWQQVARKYLELDRDDDWVWSTQQDFGNINAALFWRFSWKTHFSGWGAVKGDGDGSILSHFFGGAYATSRSGSAYVGKLAQDAYEGNTVAKDMDTRQDNAAGYLGSQFMFFFNNLNAKEQRSIMKQFADGSTKFTDVLGRKSEWDRVRKGSLEEAEFAKRHYQGMSRLLLKLSGVVSRVMVCSLLFG